LRAPPGITALQQEYHAGGRLTLAAAVSAREEEPEPLDNRAEFKIDAVPNANIALSTTPIGAQMAAGESFDVRFHVQNDGPQSASGIVVDISMSPHAVVTQAPGCEWIENHLLCPVPVLAGDADWSHTVLFRAAGEGSGSILISANALENDPVPGNNVASLEFVVRSPAPIVSAGGGCVYAPDGGNDSTIPLFLVLTLVLRIVWRPRNARLTGAAP
jgi:hypothetical protein